MVKYCPRCGYPNPDNANYCMRCGFPFLSNNLNNLQKTDKKIDTYTKLLVISIGLIFLLEFIILISFFFNEVIIDAAFNLNENDLLFALLPIIILIIIFIIFGAIFILINVRGKTFYVPEVKEKKKYYKIGSLLILISLVASLVPNIIFFIIFITNLTYTSVTLLSSNLILPVLMFSLIPSFLSFIGFILIDIYLYNIGEKYNIKKLKKAGYYIFLLSTISSLLSFITPVAIIFIPYSILGLLMAFR